MIPCHPHFLHLNDLFFPLIPLSKHKVLRGLTEAYFKVGHTDQHNKQGASDIVFQTSKYIWSQAQDSNELIPEY